MKHRGQQQEIFHPVQPRHSKECFKSICDTQSSWIFAIYCKYKSLIKKVIPVELKQKMLINIKYVANKLNYFCQTKWNAEINLQTFQTQNLIPTAGFF